MATMKTGTICNVLIMIGGSLGHVLMV